MTIFEILQEYTSNKDKYVGFKRDISTPIIFKFNNNDEIIDTYEDTKVDLNRILTVWYDLTDWILIEKEFIPEGYHKNAQGEIIKPCLCEVWVNVYQNVYGDIVEIIHMTEKEAKSVTNIDYTKNTFIKQLHLSQQYSVPYIKK